MLPLDSKIMVRSAVMMSFLLIFYTLASLMIVTDSINADSNWEDISIAADSYQAIDLGILEIGKE